jgi:stage V sporulation protein R
MNYGVDRYKRPKPISAAEEAQRQQEREDILQQQVNDLWRTIPKAHEEETEKKRKHFPSEPQENLLYFIEKNAPLLKPWQREIIRIVRKMAQYFYPQRQTQVMNEGWATFWHYTLLHTLYDEGLVNEGFMLEFLTSHTNVVTQPGFDASYYNGINPYALGFNMFQDIKRICQNPSDEDREWFPEIAGSDWLKTLHFAMKNFKDESFIQQYLSPKLIRDFKLFSLYDDEHAVKYLIDAIHNEKGYRTIRDNLSRQYDLSYREPNIQVWSVDLTGDRSLTLRHTMQNNIPLSSDCAEVMKHLHFLWSFDIHLETYSEGKKIKSIRHPALKED